MTDTPEPPIEEETSPVEGKADSEPASEAPQERRVAYRLNKVLGATLTPLTGESESTRLFIIDISTTGFRATDHKLHEVDEYEISIVLTKGAEPFSSKMRVVWNKELTVSGMFQMGCEFMETSDEQLQRLETFLTSESQKSQPASSGADLGRPWTMIR